MLAVGAARFPVGWFTSKMVVVGHPDPFCPRSVIGFPLVPELDIVMFPE
jgi:hypothetical protein